MLTEAPAKSANPRNKTHGNAASVKPGKKYSPGGWTPGAALSGNNAAFVSQSVPATMTAGESYAVTVSMLNQGTTTWTPGQAYRLGSQNPQDNTIWMTTTNRVNLLPGDSVSPGATTTFSFVVKAPGSPGSYNFQWRMVRDGVEWFGATTPNIAVQVVPRNDSATFISQNGAFSSNGSGCGVFGIHYISEYRKHNVDDRESLTARVHRIQRIMGPGGSAESRWER